MYTTVTIPYVPGIRIHLKVTNSPDFLWQILFGLKKITFKDISQFFLYHYSYKAIIKYARDKNL